MSALRFVISARLLGFAHVLCLAAILCTPPPLHAQGVRKSPRKPDAISQINTCGPHRETITTLADQIIAERHLVEGFSGRNFGTLAAYLKLRYQNMNLADGMALLEMAGLHECRSPRVMDELHLIFAVSHQGVDRGMIANGDAAAVNFVNYQFLLPREMILADQGDSYFRLLAELRGDPNLSERFDKGFYNGFRVPPLLLDQSDDFKMEFASKAEMAGEPALAALVLASRSNLDAYYSFLLRQADSDLEKLAGPRWVDANLLRTMHQTGAQQVADDDAEAALYRQNNFDISCAAFEMGGLAWLGILYNLNGQTEPIASAARGFLKAVEAGKVEPSRELETAWLLLQELLAAELGASALAADLNGFDISQNVRHFAGRAVTVLDWMRASADLAAYMNGGYMPERSELLSGEFDWERWQRIAEDLRDVGGQENFKILKI